ncbi:MAG TPA: HEAT repeat domain-containing protein, partial [Terriglobia bacterium]|nr:HEAT repeat domain-containing protein [Terriglobia bacterium]
HSGDRRPHVIGQVFDSLLQLETEKAVPFVARFLESENPEICDEAALALGNSRLASAVKILMNTWQQARGSEFRSVLLRALSVSRQESALQFLLELVAKGSDRDSAAALDALHLHKDSDEIQKLVEDARKQRQR